MVTALLVRVLRCLGLAAPPETPPAELPEVRAVRQRQHDQVTRLQAYKLEREILARRARRRQQNGAAEA